MHDGARIMLGLCQWPAQRLVVAIGDITAPPTSLANAGFMVTSRLLQNCKPPPSDIHDPSAPNTRSRSRDEAGFDRSEAAVGTVRGGKLKPGAVFEIRSRLRAWDTAAFRDHLGLFCDRVALGSPPVRAAVLQPHTSPGDVGLSIGRVLRENKTLDACDVLMVVPTDALPVGRADLSTLRGAERAGLVTTTNSTALLSANGAFASALGPDAGLSSCVLAVGCGGLTAGRSLRAPLAGPDAQRWLGLVAPRLAFAAAYWCSHPAKAAAFARLPAPRQPDDDDRRLLQSLQRGLLSTRDEAILRAYARGEGACSQSMDADATMKQAAGILLRLAEENTT